MSDELFERWISVANGMQRLFYLILAVALVVFYLILESCGLTTIPVGRSSLLRSSVRSQLESLQPLVALGDSLRNRPNLVAGYKNLIKELRSIEEDSDSAVRDVPKSDPRWSSVSAADRRLASERKASLVDLDLDLDLYDLDNIRTQSLYNLDDTFIKLFVHPERFLDTEAIREDLQADWNVAKAMAFPIDSLKTVPKSLTFEYFVLTQEPSGPLPGLIAAVGSVQDLSHFLG